MKKIPSNWSSNTLKDMLANRFGAFGWKRSPQQINSLPEEESGDNCETAKNLGDDLFRWSFCKDRHKD